MQDGVQTVSSQYRIDGVLDRFGDFESVERLSGVGVQESLDRVFPRVRRLAPVKLAAVYWHGESRTPRGL